MCKVSRKRWWLIIGLAVWLGLECFKPASCAAQYVAGPSSPPKSSYTDSFKQGFNKVGNFFTPKTNKEQPSANDPVSLKNQNKPGPELYVAIARLYEESGKNTEAEQYYQMALKERPDDLKSLLGYARLQENQGRFNEAIALYQQALKAHPKEAVAYNNLGLCHARRGNLNEAAQALGQAKQLDPRNPLYRNNLAAVQVDQNRLADAFANLREVHGDAAAYYNIGYLLNKKGQTEAAEHHFAQALRADPTMAPAQRWLSYLQNKSRQATSGQMSDGAIRVGSLADPSRFPARVITPSTSPTASTTASPPSKPTGSPALTTPTRLPPPGSGAAVPGGTEESSAAQAQLETPPMPPAINMPQRLPPVYWRQGTAQTQSFQEMPASTTSDPTAPMPPGM